LRKKNRLAWLRFFSLVGAGIALWQLWSLNWIVALIVSILLVALFLRVVIMDINNRESIENTRRLIEINKEEIEILNHHFTNRPDGKFSNPNITTMQMILTSSAKHRCINTSTAPIQSREINYSPIG
jgi:hypothetical protein